MAESYEMLTDWGYNHLHLHLQGSNRRIVRQRSPFWNIHWYQINKKKPNSSRR